MSEPGPSGEKKDESIAWTIFMAIILSIFPACILWSCVTSNRSGSESAQASQEDEKAMAITMAQNFVKERLKSPSSASFPVGFDEYRATRSDNGTWSVSGWVESVNSFRTTGQNLNV